MKDMLGKIINPGDYITYGADNGSSLYIGKVYKLTPKKCWFYHVYKDEESIKVDEHQPCTRDYNRIVVITL